MRALAPREHDRAPRSVPAANGAATAASPSVATRTECPSHGLENELRRMLESAEAPLDHERGARRLELRRWWRDRGCTLTEAPMTDLLALASAWGDWPLSREVGRTLERQRTLAPHEAWWLVLACRQMGDLAEAIDLCRSRMFAHPNEPWPMIAHRALRSLIEFHDTVAPALDSATLRLEPLGHHHCEDFARQYYDPAIAELCCLPDFASSAHWHRWLDDCWACGDQRLYAVIDPDWGFVGSVSLILHQGVGFFYYWIGRDFQGHGLGTAAVRLLLDDAAEYHGMRACYAKVFEHNVPSRRALAKLGFEPLDVRPAPPDETEMLYRLGPPQPRQRTVEDLHELFRRMRSETRVATPTIVVQRGNRRPSAARAIMPINSGEENQR